MKPSRWIQESLAEMTGTFILVFFGTGVVHAGVLTQTQSGLWQVAVVWGAAVGLAIYAVAAVSGAHINPAITVALAVRRGFPWLKMPHYVLSQFLGAALAAALLYVLFQGPLLAFEQANHIVRGLPGSELSAMVYGEYFPNPMVAKDLGWAPECVGRSAAFLAEAAGTGLLAFFVFALTDKRNTTAKGSQAILIGLAIAALVSVIAPLTQACFNPARDFGPRCVAYLAGWKAVAIPGPRGGFFSVYILAPVVGAVTGALLYEALVGYGLEGKIREENMKPVRFLLVGGFLGAGKTTLLYRAATELIQAGRRVGLVTNDQAPDLVDTQMLGAHGLAVGEVAGSCFCCNFNGLVDAARGICPDGDRPDVVLAEPVGSCTDLSATIVQPLKDRFAGDFSIGPLSVLIDPQRAMAVLGGRQTLLHPSAAYIYRKQLEEADRIVVNKSDLLTDDGRQGLIALLRREFPHTKISLLSCETGDGLKGWLDDVLSDARSGERILEIDYDTYAAGEAVLGWLNARFGLNADDEMDWADVCRRYLEAVQEKLRSIKAPIGHVKLFLSAAGKSLTANLTAVDGPVRVRKGEESFRAKHADMTFNARVQMEPDRLQRVSLETFRECFPEVSVRTEAIRSLRPGRPRPTFRYAKTM